MYIALSYVPYSISRLRDLKKRTKSFFVGEKNLDLEIITINITFKVERLFFRSSQN